MSLSVVPAHWLQVGIAAAEGDGGFQAPGTEDFFWPVIGGDSNWAITRPMLLMALSLILITGWLLVTTRKRALVPSRGQMGSKDFLRFVPLLFSMFVLILVNNLFGVIPPMSYPTMSRIGFPIALALIVWIVFHVVGMKKHGFFGYWKSLVPSGLPKGMIVPIFILAGVID